MSAVGGDAQKPTDWMDEVASSAVLEAAFAWLCTRRVDYSDMLQADLDKRRHEIILAAIEKASDDVTKFITYFVLIIVLIICLGIWWLK